MAVKSVPDNTDTPWRRGVEGVSHISIFVSDIERSLPFYRDLLGMTVSIDQEIERDATTRDGRSVHIHRRVIWLRWEDRPGATFVLLSQHLEREPSGRPTQLGELGVDHIALKVDDVERIAAQAREMGEGVIVVEPHTATGEEYGHPGGTQTILTVLLRDPDGTLVQIDNWL